MLLSIILHVKPLFQRYAYSIYGGKYKYVLYFRSTKHRDWFKITLMQYDDHVSFVYESLDFTQTRDAYTKQKAIDILTHYIKSSLKLY